MLGLNLGILHRHILAIPDPGTVALNEFGERTENIIACENLQSHSRGERVQRGWGTCPSLQPVWSECGPKPGGDRLAEQHKCHHLVVVADGTQRILQSSSHQVAKEQHGGGERKGEARDVKGCGRIQKDCDQRVRPGVENPSEIDPISQAVRKAKLGAGSWQRPERRKASQKEHGKACSHDCRFPPGEIYARNDVGESALVHSRAHLASFLEEFAAQRAACKVYPQTRSSPRSVPSL